MIVKRLPTILPHPVITVIQTGTMESATVCQTAARSLRSMVLLVEELVYGKYNYDVGPVVFVRPVKVPLISESLRETPKSAGLQHAISTGSQPHRVGSIGRREQRGEIITELCTNGWGPLLFKHATTSNVVTTPVAGPPQRVNHVGVTDIDAALPTGLSIDKRFYFPDGIVHTQRYLGCRVESLSCAIGKGKPVQLRASIIGRERVENSDNIHTRYHPEDIMLFGDDFTVAIDKDGDGSAELVGNVVRAQFVINNSLGMNCFPIAGGGLRDRLPQGQRHVSGRISAFFVSDDESLFDRWLGNDDVGIILTGIMQSDANQWAIFTFPAAKIRGSPVPQVSGRGLIRIDFSFVAMTDAVLGYDFRWEIQNVEGAVSTGTVTRVI